VKITRYFSERLRETVDERNEEKQNSYEIENIIGGSIPGRWKAGGRMRESKREGEGARGTLCAVSMYSVIVTNLGTGSVIVLLL